ncbi:phospholipase A2 inhibitor 25 kDa subunit-like [Mantella aurantiaca]
MATMRGAPKEDGGPVTVSGHFTTSCRICKALGSTECLSEKEMECDGTKCMMMSEYSNISNELYYAVKKSCADDNICGKCFSVSTNHDLKLRVGVECREGFNSNADMNFTEGCPDPLPLNNLQCPSCNVMTTNDDCENKGMVLCGGNEKVCLDYQGLIEWADGRQVPMSVKGCATNNTCVLGSMLFPDVKELKRIFLNCTDALPVPSAGGN